MGGEVEVEIGVGYFVIFMLVYSSYLMEYALSSLEVSYYGQLEEV